MRSPIVAAAGLAVVLSVTAPARASGGEAIDVILLVDTSESMMGFSLESLNGFVDMFRRSQRLGVVTFGGEPAIVAPLESAATDAERGKLKKALGRLEFGAVYKDFPGGLALALSHMRTEGRDDAARIVVLLSNGDLVPSADDSTEEEVLEVMRADVLYDYYLENVAVYPVAYGTAANLPVMQEIRSATRGRLLVAPDAVALDDAFTVLLTGIQPPATREDVEPPPDRPGRKPRTAVVTQGVETSGSTDTLVWILSIFVALLVIVNLVMIAVLLQNTSRVGTVIRQQQDQKDEKRGEEEAPELTSLRKKAGGIEKLLEEARSRLDGFTTDLDDWGAESWEREKKLRNRFHSISENLFLLVDHLEAQEKEGERSLEIDWVESRVRKLFDGEGIREIPVQEGDEFDGMYHEHAGDRRHKTPPGTILEVVRRGWYIPRPGDEDDLILRHADVVVSRGDRA